MPADPLPGTVAIWWIGEATGDPALLEGVALHVGAELGVDVTLADPVDRPRATWDARRRQHSSRAVLQWVIDQLCGQPRRVLAITDVDLFMPVLTFVFGEAQLGGFAAVISTARLHDSTSADITLDRVRCEAVHELGHTFGLLHCDRLLGTGRRTRRCVMTRSASLRAVDEKSGHLCSDCRARFAFLQQDGTHVYREHQNPHR